MALSGICRPEKTEISITKERSCLCGTCFSCFSFPVARYFGQRTTIFVRPSTRLAGVQQCSGLSVEGHRSARAQTRSDILDFGAHAAHCSDIVVWVSRAVVPRPPGRVVL